MWDSRKKGRVGSQHSHLMYLYIFGMRTVQFSNEPACTVVWKLLFSPLTCLFPSRWFCWKSLLCLWWSVFNSWLKFILEWKCVGPKSQTRECIDPLQIWQRFHENKAIQWQLLLRADSLTFPLQVTDMEMAFIVLTSSFWVLKRCQTTLMELLDHWRIESGAK